MKWFAAVSLLCGSMTSCYLGVASGATATALNRQEMAMIDGGQTYFCCTAFPTATGCFECLLVYSNFGYIDGGMWMMVNVYKRCDNNSANKSCLQNQYSTQPNPTCTKTTNQTCGTLASAYIDNQCSQAMPDAAKNASNYPTSAASLK